MKIATQRLNKKAEFGDMVAGENVNPNTGEPILEFKADFTLRAGVYSRSQSQQIALSGTDLEDTLVLIIRHNTKVSKKMKVKIDTDLYQIVSISFDDSLPNSYDLITIKQEVVKHD